MNRHFLNSGNGLLYFIHEVGYDNLVEGFSPHSFYKKFFNLFSYLQKLTDSVNDSFQLLNL